MHCTASGENLQQMFVEDQSLMRSIATQERDLRNIQRNKVHENGVKEASCLNELNYFNAVDGFPPDAMHDILEGTARQNLVLLMAHLKSTKAYTVELLNEDLRRFKYGRLDGENKVPNSLFTDLSTCKTSARHMWTLCAQTHAVSHCSLCLIM